MSGCSRSLVVLLMQLSLSRILCLTLAVAAVAETGCRAIRRFGESRQTIAARRLSGQGFQAMHDGEWEMAETLFSDALQVSKSDDRAHWGLAESYWKRGETELAIEEMEQAVRLGAGDPKLVQRLGRMYLDLGRLSEADKHSLWALESTRDSAEAWALRGDCLQAAGKYEESLAAYHRALRLQPDYPEVQLQAAEIYRLQERYDRLLATLGVLEDNIGTEETAVRVDLLKGIAMRKLDRVDEARRCFVRASTKDPSDHQPHMELAALALQRGDVTAARQSFETALTLDPDGPADMGDDDWIANLQNQQERLALEPGLKTSGVPVQR